MTNWTPQTGNSTGWSNPSPVDTSWNEVSGSNISWSGVSLNSTSFGDRETYDLGATMDDLSYEMDSTVVSMDDRKLYSYVAPATNWT